MKSFNLPSATAALFIVAALVACHGIGTGYNPTVSQDLAEGTSTQDSLPLKIPTCTAKKVGQGTYLFYDASGNVKGATFKALTGKSDFAEWVLLKYAKVKPTPTPKPPPTPKPTPTPKPVSYYFYYGTFAMKNKQVGCAYLETTVKGTKIKGADYNGLTFGEPNIEPGHYSSSVVDEGPISSLAISQLSSKGGNGSATLVTTKGKAYTTGSIKLVGRIVVKISDDADGLLRALSKSQ